ncbi:ABC transporter ATP-binding protein [Estrella lausannensis]|uniref:ABC-type transporter, permease subunit n=1 Tax=Estrella lausannensis TaxID=483423 RepID=A0A0H5DS07_9BACT|nr:ABC transporter ATP-binding protein [Estrella lausannensis]CRX39043.1 ABC-type transporter, permease subunit [Estrella lausannensis]
MKGLFLRSGFSERKIFSRLLRYILPYKAAFILSFVFLFLSKAVEALAPLMIGYLVRNTFADNPINYGLSPLSFFCGIALFISFGFLFEFLHVRFKAEGGEKALFDLRRQVFSHIQNLPVNTFDRVPSGMLLTRTIHDVEQVSLLFSDSLVPLIGSFFLFVSMIGAITYIDFKSGLILLIILPFAVGLALRFRYVQEISFTKVRHLVAMLNIFIQERLQGLFIIREFGLEKREMAKFSKLNQELKKAHVSTIHNFAFFIAGIDVMTNFFIISSAGFLIYSAAGSKIDPGAFVTILLYSAVLFRPLVDLAERYNVLQSSLAAFERIASVLDMSAEDVNTGGELSTIEEIGMQNVSFSYGREESVLKRVEFTLKRGQWAAIVGMSGAGKSSILSLLLGFYRASSGTVTLNGKAIESFSKESLRKRIAPVFQDPIIISGSLKDNITLFQKEEDGVIEGLIEKMGLTGWLAQFPQGIHTPIKEKGKNISVGEAQLVSLLRALYSGRDLLLLDEALSSVDIATERLLEKGLIDSFGGRIALVVSHRFSLVAKAPLILVMEKGEIKEAGGHSELMAKKGIYEKLSRLQSVGMERF